MSLDYSIRFTDIAIVFATILGPILAVWASEFRRKNEEKRERKARLFRTLMATRSLPVAPVHVEAINQIEMEFSSPSQTDRAVIEAWRLYRAHLDSYVNNDGWISKRADLHASLIVAISTALGYGFTRADIQQGVYYPTAHSEADSENQRTRKLWLEILEGKRALPMKNYVEHPTLPLAKLKDS